jgi:high-affinity nickel permease
VEYDFTRSVAPLVVIVAVAAVALTSVMAPSTVFMMVLPSMIVFSVIAYFFGLKHGEFRTSR